MKLKPFLLNELASLSRKSVSKIYSSQSGYFYTDLLIHHKFSQLRSQCCQHASEIPVVRGEVPSHALPALTRGKRAGDGNMVKST
jgi:hypothetical protein